MGGATIRGDAAPPRERAFDGEPERGCVDPERSCASGAGDRVGCFESRVAGIGPQIGYIIPISNEYQGYINLKGYKEFAAEHRADGWNVWLTFAISPAAKQPPAAKPIITK